MASSFGSAPRKLSALRAESIFGMPRVSPTSCDTLDELSDAELVARCRDGAAGAWATLVRRFQRLVYTVPRRAGLSEAEAADVFQLAFTRLVEHLGRLDDPGRVRAWLVTTARRETLKLLERERRTVAWPGAVGEDDEDPLASLPDPAPLPETLLAELQEQDRLRRAVARLDDRSRAFVELLFLHEPPLGYAEIAARLGIAEGSIGPTRARCLDKLRRLLATV
jgi:RNA polymerase sigma factor (sigma-70 family)